VVEHLRLAGLSFGNQAVVQDIENIPADLLELLLDLVSVLFDLSNVLVGSLSFLFLLDGGDDSPRGTSCSHNILVGDRQKIALINRQFSSDLIRLVTEFWVWHLVHYIPWQPPITRKNVSIQCLDSLVSPHGQH